MATKKSRQLARKASSTAPDQMTNMLHQVWLAGLGAVAKAKRDTPQLLQELIAEGARLHEQTRGTAEKAIRAALGDARATINSRLAKVQGQAADSLEGLEKVFQTRVHRVLTQLGVPSAEDVEALGKRVDTLNGNVQKLLHARGKAPPRSRLSVNSRNSRPSAAA